MPDKRPYKAWTHPEYARLRALRDQGKTYLELAGIFGRSVAALQRKCAREGDVTPMTDLLGRIMRKVTIDPETGCWIWSGMLRGGQPFFRPDGRRNAAMCERNVRAVLLQLDGKWRPSSYVCSAGCGEALCVAPEHARQLTQRQHLANARPDRLRPDAKARTTSARRKRSAVTPELVSDIRSRAAQGEPRDKLLADWPYSRQSLDDVLARRTWCEVSAASVFSGRAASAQ